MVVTRQFRGSLFVFDDVLDLELVHASESFEQFDGQLRQLAGCVAVKVIDGFDVGVGFTLVFMLLLVLVVVLMLMVVRVVMLVMLMTDSLVKIKVGGLVHLMADDYS